MSTQLKNPKDWFAAARIASCQKMPYFSSAVMSLVPYEVPGLGTMGITERGVLMWDPALAAKWSVEEASWIVLHEAFHWVREHARRCKAHGAEHHAWNLAGDCESNDDLVAAGARFPALTAEDTDDASKVGQPSGVLPKDFGCKDGLLAEEYYDAARKQQQQQRGSGKGKGKGAPKLATNGKASCGSGAGGEPLPGEAEVPADMGKSPAEQKRVQREVAEAIRRASSKGRGTVPAGMVRWAEEVLGPPVVPWQQTLARLCRQAVAFRAGVGDYRYDRPSRRQSVYGYGPGSAVIPALRQPIPRVDVLVDTSGSMGDAELKQGLTEVKGILAAVGADVGFYCCDAEVHTATRVRSIDEARKNLKGGGGTDMKPALEMIARSPKKGDVLVCVTDGQIGDAGPAPVGVNVIWLVCGQYRNAKPAPWGTIVEMPVMGVAESEF